MAAEKLRRIDLPSDDDVRPYRSRSLSLSGRKAENPIQRDLHDLHVGVISDIAVLLGDVLTHLYQGDHRGKTFFLRVLFRYVDKHVHDGGQLVSLQSVCTIDIFIINIFCV